LPAHGWTMARSPIHFERAGLFNFSRPRHRGIEKLLGEGAFRALSLLITQF